MSWPANNAFTTPQRTGSMADKAALEDGVPASTSEDTGPALHPRYAEFSHRFARTEARLLALLQGKGPLASHDVANGAGQSGSNGDHGDTASASKSATAPATRKPARAIDEDDYGDEDEEEEDTTMDGTSQEAQQAVQPPADPRAAEETGQDKADGAPGVSAADAQLTDGVAKRKFRDYFFTLENDRDAMLEQQRLDAMEAQIAAETTGQPAVNGNTSNMAGQSVESLSSTNLGATSLVMKNLFRRIDEKRSQIKATDTEIRNIIRDVRKGRSKWASDDKVNQEELYEAAEQVLNSLKAETEYVGPFLQKVNKRDAPDYYQVIKQPMDLGTMFKKLKNLAYKSKKDFVGDLNLIWANCLHYNGDPAHFLRKKALYMRKRSEELLQHVPDVVIRDRAEVEAEERRRQKFEIGLGGDEDSDDEEPIMASRGRKAPKKGVTARKQAPARADETPAPDTKPTLNHTASSTGLRDDFLRPDSEAPATNGFTTPPPGSITPLGPNGLASSVAHGSQADVSEMMELAVEDGHAGPAEEPEVDDPDLKAWKQATKKGRARVSMTRHKLFRGDKLNVEEAALLRNKAGMRRWLRHQIDGDDDGGDADALNGKDGSKAITGETIAEGLEEEEEGYLPDYYDPLAAIPDLEPRLRWEEDSEGHATALVEETLRMLPSKSFVSVESNLSKKMDANMKQMQETRKLCAKIGVVKQMQLQQQMYQNQFQKYSPSPLVEIDVEPQVVSDEGPLMAPWVCRSALQRSVGKIFYHAGFEEFQPSALEAVTDLASDYFGRLVSGLVKYHEEPKVLDKGHSTTADRKLWRPMYTKEESILHALHSAGVDMEGLETYVKDDVDRLETKLGVMHDRMKSHLAELLRPALNADAGADGVGAFADGSEEFVSGDFAQDVDEDFFGFKDLGLDKEFGLSTLSVPLHLLQNRMYSLNQQQNTGAVSTTGVVMEPLPPIEPVSTTNIGAEIGLVQDFFLQKLHAGSDEPLVEDEDLPVKQRFPKPRLPPTGKITSPRKRPIREQQQLAKKKRKLEEAAANGEAPNSGEKSLGKPLEKKLRLEMPREKENVQDPEKDDALGSPTGMMSPPDSM